MFVETAPPGVPRPVLDTLSVRNIPDMFGTVAVGFHVVVGQLLNLEQVSVDLSL